MDNKEKLMIPVNVPETNDFLPGFGKKEIAITAFTSIIAVVFIIVLNGITGSLITSIISGAVLVAVVVFAIRRDRFNESMIDKVRIMNQFSNTQKKYYYQFFNMYQCDTEWKGEE